MQLPQKIITDDERIHHTKLPIASGGQGIVATTKIPEIAVKLALQNSQPIRDLKKIQQYKKRLQQVLYLPLPKSLPITLPKSLLKNEAGYILDYLPDMQPWNKVFLQKHGSFPNNIPQFYQSTLEKHRDFWEFWFHYAQTGGTKLRLFALYKVACLLQELHGRSIIYGDISQNNVFIQLGSSRGLKQANECEIWLIDVDNLEFDSAQKAMRVYTPPYGSPEVVSSYFAKKEIKYHPSSDCHAFGVLAFKTLLGRNWHPFVGSKVFHTEDSWGDGFTPEQQAMFGHFPWVFDQSDPSNKQAHPFLHRILSKEIFGLFDKTFDDGRLNPIERPKIFHWPKALAKAADVHLRCHSCFQTFDITQHDACPYCHEKRFEYYLIESFQWNGKDTPLINPLWSYVVNKKEQSEIQLPHRLFFPFQASLSDQEILEIRPHHHQKQNFSIEYHKEKKISFASKSKSKFQTLTKGETVIRKSLDRLVFYVPESQRLILVRSITA